MRTGAPPPGGPVPLQFPPGHASGYDGGMTGTKKRLSRPLYEGLPWIYVAGGAAALFGSYVSHYRALAVVIGVLGLLGVLGGIVVLLRRRDYRQMRSQYGNSDQSLNDVSED
jgi:hypothetical protein